MIDERVILDRINRGEIALPPLSIRSLPLNRIDPNGRMTEIDVLLEIAWGDETYRFAAECKSSSTPKSVRDAIEQIVRLAPAFDSLPMVIVPWLSPKQLADLEERQVSGIDLCGNGVVIVPKRLLVFRTGRPNAYPESRPIKDIYRGDSSVVARVYLLKPRYESITEVFKEVRLRSGRVALSTVSKVLKQLEDDLIISKEGKATRLLQPDKLMDSLAASYRPAPVMGRFIGRSKDNMAQALARVAGDNDYRVVMTGVSSATRYATMASEPVQSFYCARDPREVLDSTGIGVEETERFPNFELLYTDEAAVYFDRRIEPEAPFASPVQTWLELNAGDKRLREVADQVKQFILRNLERTEAAND